MTRPRRCRWFSREPAGRNVWRRPHKPRSAGVRSQAAQRNHMAPGLLWLRLPKRSGGRKLLGMPCVYAGTGARLLDGPASDRPASDRPACDRPGIDRRLRRHPLGEESSGNPPSGDHASAADAAAADSPRSHPDGGQLEPHRILWCLSCEDRLRERTSLAAGALATALVGAALATAEVRPLALRTPCAASPQPHPAPEPPRSSRCCAPRRALPHPD